MASDYKKIAEDHEKRYGWDAKPRRIYKRLYSDKTHFIYELIQNADDSGSDCLELQLDSNTLLVWNDGRQFTEEDVRNICSLGSSDKDLTDIGTFGIGFKAVYNYTEFPEIYSSDERFRIRDFIKPEGIDEITPEIVKLIDEGKTVFRLPFKNNLPQDDLEHLKNRLCDLSKERSLLFLRCLKRVEWKDERNAQAGFYSCSRLSYDKIQNVPENESIELVKLTVALNGNSESSETFLVFCKSVHPPKDVIDKLLEQAEDEEEQQRIQQSAEESQPIEVAFKLQDDRITPMDDNCVLFAYLPTQKETHLKFLIQARYQTTPSRDNIPKPSENPWNRWLVWETANFLPEVLEQLKVGGLLEPTFFNVLPLKEDNVPAEFAPIAEGLQKAMRERAFVPTQSGGYTKVGSVFHVNSKGVTILRGAGYRYARADNVYYPHTEILRQLIESNWLHPESSWLHPEIRDTVEFRQCFKIMQEAGVKSVEVSRVLGWLEDRDSDWFKGQSNEWLHFLHAYLKEQKSQLERVKKLPLARLENGRHVCASNELVFFPPDPGEVRNSNIKQVLKDLPILHSVQLEVEERDEIEAFLKNVGVKFPRPANLIYKGICPQYHKSVKPSIDQNRWHVRYIFKFWQKGSGSERSSLEEELSKTPILRAYSGIQRGTSNKSLPLTSKTYYVKAYDVYMSKAYTGDDNLETYFSIYNGEVWFVDDTYLEADSNRKEWLQFLKAIGAMDTPRVIEVKVPCNHEECEKRDISREKITRTGKETIEDRDLLGLSTVLHEIGEYKKLPLSRALWYLLVKAVPSAKSERETFFKGTYRSQYRSNSSLTFDRFDAKFYSQLKKTAWLPDEQGNLHPPSKCFAPTSENRTVLANSVIYLHSDFNIGTEPTQWIAEKLRVRLKPDAESVLNYLQKLSNSTEVSVAKVEPLYRFLQREVEDARLRDKFKKESLIFTSNPEPRWWRSDEVFWEDESEVFKNDRGYLKTYYPATLKSFFTDDLGVSPQASQQDYALGIQEIATTEQAEDKKVRERVQKLYKCLEAWRVSKWELIYDSRCWLGKKGEEWGFFTRQELVLKDHPHIGEIFEGEVPFWMFDDDLSNLARNLKLEGCSQAEIEFHPEGNREEDTDWSEKVQNLRLDLYAFLNSPRLYEESGMFIFFDNYEEHKEKFAKLSTNCSVWRVKELKVTYELKGTSVTDPNPRQSFLDVTDQQAKLWLGLEENEGEYPELIGDALQDYFGVKDLGRFVENLLGKKDRDKVLSSWKRKGLDTKFLDEDLKDDEKRQIESLDERFPDEPNNGDADPAADESDMRIPTDNETSKTDDEDNDSVTADESETHFSRSKDDDLRTDESEIETSIDSEAIAIDKSNDNSTADESKNSTNSVSDILNISSPDTQSSTKTGDGAIQNVNGESESETPTVHEDPETENGNDDSKENEPETSTYQSRSSGSRTRPRGGKAINTPNENQGTGHSNGRSGDREDDTHMAETSTSSHARREIEHIGMKHAYHYEKKQGRTPKDVSSENRGYDIYSTSLDGKNRCIEVKARADRASVLLTSNEWSIARELKDGYFLYVVLNATAQPELYVIQNPADEISAVEQIDVRYHVPLSEIMEHGIPV